MSPLGFGTSIALIAAGTWLLGWGDAGIYPASVPWGGMSVLGAGLIGLVLCILADLTGTALDISQSPQPETGEPGQGKTQPIDNHERTLTMSGKFDEAKGRAKEAVGDLTDNEDLKRKGKADQTAGKVKEKVDDAKDWVEDKIDKARGKVD